MTFTDKFFGFVCCIFVKIFLMERENLKIQTLDCEGLQIAATLETDTIDEHPVYYPSTVLFYMQQGQFNFRPDQQLHVIPEGSFFLIRKYTHGKCFKTWGPKQDGAKSLIFIFQDQFLQNVIKDIPVNEQAEDDVEDIIQMPKTTMLMGLMDSLTAYFKGKSELDADIVQLKTLEALMAITKSNPDVVHAFKEFSQAERANLVEFMNHNFMYNFSLEKFASMSGRSLSTFNRDFKSLFSESPHKWIMKQRLQLAKKLLINKGKKASDVYLEVGFEDLAHFSKRFKNFFGVNPSEISRLAV